MAELRTAQEEVEETETSIGGCTATELLQTPVEGELSARYSEGGRTNVGDSH